MIHLVKKTASSPGQIKPFSIMKIGLAENLIMSMELKIVFKRTKILIFNGMIVHATGILLMFASYWV